MLSKSGKRRHNKAWQITLANAEFNKNNEERKELSYCQIQEACKKWFKEFLHINVSFVFSKTYLEIDGFSIELSDEEVWERAMQYKAFKRGEI